jgi:electron transport complex protein RnfB
MSPTHEAARIMSADAAPDLTARIDALLPQTQCTRCGYDGCHPYAAAVARRRGANQSMPARRQRHHRIPGALAASRALPLNPANGVEAAPRVAWIDESRCIGCARCLPPCPVDAIVGANKFLHTVLPDVCTGCELCIAPCPVDCIEMRPAPAGTQNDADLNRARYHAHTDRLAHRAQERMRALEAKKASVTLRNTSNS